MKVSLYEYLSTFNKELNSRYNDENNFSVNKFFKDLKANKIILTGLDRYNYDESINYPWLDELSIVIEKILAIASKPRTHIKSYKEVKNSEQAVRLTTEDINMTLQVTKYWKNMEGTFVPEKVFNDAYETEYAIYENKFIILLIDKLMVFLTKEISRLFNMVRTINKDYINGNVDLSNVDSIDNMKDVPLFKNGKRVDNLYYSLLTTNKSPFIDSLIKLLEIRKKLSIVLSTPFYKVVKKERPLSDNDIHITNLLAGDETYAPCFKFYRNLPALMSGNKEDKLKQNKSDYKDYVLLNLLLAFKESSFTFIDDSIELVDNHLSINKLRLKKDNFELVLVDNKYNFDLYIYNKRLDKDSNPLSYESKVAINLVSNVNNLYPTSDELSVYFSKINKSNLNKGYSNSFVITACNETKNDDVIICSPYSYQVGSNIKNMIKSCLIKTEGSKYIYTNLCPICGFYVDGEQEDGNCHCSNCESIYSLLVTGNNQNRKEIIWIKKLSNPNKI